MLATASASVANASDRATATRTIGPFLLLMSLFGTHMTAFSLLGLLDDIAGVGQSGGFRSHIRSIVSGNLSTGAVKVVGGAAAGVLVAARVPVSDPDVLSALRDGAVIARFAPRTKPDDPELREAIAKALSNPTP